MIDDRRPALLVALPMLLFGLSVAAVAGLLTAIGGPSEITRLARGPVWHYGALIIALIALVALVGAAIAALRGRLPVWSYTWIGASLVGQMIALNLVVEDRPFVLSPLLDATVLLLLALSALVTFGTASSRGWQHSGLYVLSIATTLGMALCFFGVAGPFDAYQGVLAGLLGALEAALAYLYVRGSDPARLVALVGVGAANVAVAWSVERGFRSVYPERGTGQFWALVAVLTALLIIGTLVRKLGAVVRRRLGRT